MFLSSLKEDTALPIAVISSQFELLKIKRVGIIEKCRRFINRSSRNDGLELDIRIFRQS